MPKYTLIQCGKLYDGLTDALQEQMQILVEDNLVKEVDKKVAIPPDTETIDLSNATVTPGLIDAHVHLGTGDWRKRRQETIYESPAFKGMVVLHNAKKAMQRGFTSLRYVGNNCNDDFGSVVAKRMINDGYFEGARLKVAPHYMGSTRGHADASQLISSNPQVCNFIWEQYPGYISGPDMTREKVRRQAKFGADFIKLFATGGFSTPEDGPEDITLTDEEMRVAIETAHQLNLKITSHSYAPPLIWKQIELGIDGIEHGALIDDPALLQLMIDKGIEFVPTFSPYDSVINQDGESLQKWPLEMQNKLRGYAEWLTRARKCIVDSGIAFGYGTDFVAQHHCYDCGYEYETMRNSGVDPFRALAAATRVNAKIMQMEGLIGVLQPGCYADIAAWRRDLLEDPKALLDCYFVMKDGVIYPTEPSE